MELRGCLLFIEPSNELLPCEITARDLPANRVLFRGKKETSGTRLTSGIPTSEFCSIGLGWSNRIPLKNGSSKTPFVGINKNSILFDIK